MRNNEHDANVALDAAIARKNAHTVAAQEAPTVEAFREHIRRATDAWAEERKLRAERAVARFA